MKSKLKLFFISKQLYIYAFLLPVVMMLFLLIGNSIYPFGNSSFLNIDMYHQYFPFLSEFYHKIKEGESLLYSFQVGIGSNFIDLFGYYLASPTNWLVLLCPEEYIIEFMTYMTVIKIGLCSLTFTIYARHHFDAKKSAMIFFGFAYAFSGYLAAYNWNVMWLDCIILAPIILLGLERLVLKGKCNLYCITLALSIITNYYLSIMLCIFLIFYFFVLLVSSKEKLKAFGRFTLYSLIAGGIAGVLLFPALGMLTQSEYATSTFPSKITTYFPIFDVLSRQLANVSIETGLDHWPNIYSGVAVLFLLPLYMICKNIPTKEKIGKLALLFLLLLSFSNNILTFLWHGFNYPNSLPSRQSFLYILLLLIMCLEAFLNLSSYTKEQFYRIGGGIVIFLILCQKLVIYDGITPASYILTCVALIGFAVILYFYYTRKYSQRTLFIMTLLLLVGEMTFNMAFTSLSTVSRESYLKYNESIDTLITNLKEEDTDFYRINKEEEITKNDGAIVGFPSLTLFSSTTNSNINNFYEKYGLQESKVYYGNEGLTPFMSAFLTNKYIITKSEKPDSPLYSKTNQEGDIFLYENTYTLPLGYMISNDLPLEGIAPNPLEQQNRLASFLGTTDALFDKISVDSIKDTASFITTENGHVYAFADNNKVKEVTATINGTKQTFKKLKNSYIIDLGYLEANTEVSLLATESATISLSAYSLNENQLSLIINNLKEQSFIIDTHNEFQIEGHIQVLEDGHLLLAIPYEPNWEITVDGVKTTYDAFEEAFIRIPLTKGTHTISLNYTNPSLSFGIIISFISILIFIFLAIFNQIQKSKSAKTSTTS